MPRSARGLATAGLLLLAAAGPSAFAAEDNNAAMEQKALLIVPALEDYIAANMKAFDVPGLAIGIVVGDKVVYARGFGVRSKGGEPVDTYTVFQIGSTTKAFLATTMAIAVDQGKLRWDEQVVDLDPGFQLKDPWVSQEFRVFDLLAQRSSLPPYANDTLVFLGFDAGAMIRSLRFVDPASSFRSTFAYTNITHLVASRLVASVEGAKEWTEVLQKEIFDPLGMKDSTDMAAGIESAPNHAEGYRYDPAGSVEAPFTPIFPYAFEGAGAINSNVEDMVQWLRLQLGNGTFEGNKIVSPENLDATRIAKVGISDHRRLCAWLAHPADAKRHDLLAQWRHPGLRRGGGFRAESQGGDRHPHQRDVGRDARFGRAVGARPDHGQPGRRLCRHVP